MKLYSIKYKDESDPGCPEFSLRIHAHSAEHARERFQEDDIDGGGWTILSVKLAKVA
jgi:hypothetical protein